MKRSIEQPVDVLFLGKRNSKIVLISCYYDPDEMVCRTLCDLKFTLWVSPDEFQTIIRRRDRHFSSVIAELHTWRHECITALEAKLDQNWIKFFIPIPWCLLLTVNTVLYSADFWLMTRQSKTFWLVHINIFEQITLQKKTVFTSSCNICGSRASATASIARSVSSRSMFHWCIRLSFRCSQFPLFGRNLSRKDKL